MKKIIYLISILFLIGLFFASPYILDYWQYKSALEAAGGMPITDGLLSTNITPCEPSCESPIIPACCISDNGACAAAQAQGDTAAPVCPGFEMVVTQSAGGQTCKTAYFLNILQQPILVGSKNAIIGGTTCTKLQVVASEKGCLGCTAMINNNKVYAFKNELKSITDKFIIAGKKLLSH